VRFALAATHEVNRSEEARHLRPLGKMRSHDLAFNRVAERSQ
jgi:hypothetical protein